MKQPEPLLVLKGSLADAVARTMIVEAGNDVDFLAGSKNVLFYNRWSRRAIVQKAEKYKANKDHIAPLLLLGDIDKRLLEAIYDAVCDVWCDENWDDKSKRPQIRCINDLIKLVSRSTKSPKGKFPEIYVLTKFAGRLLGKNQIGRVMQMMIEFTCIEVWRERVLPTLTHKYQPQSPSQ